MTSLTIFAPDITTLEAQLAALQTQLDELRQAEDIATQLLSTLADTLPRFEKLGAIARVKSAVLELFGDTTTPKLESFVAEVPTTEEIFDAEVMARTIEDAIASNTPSVPAEADTPEVEPAPTVEPVSETEQMNYIELVELNPTVAYQRKHDGEIVCAYLGTANQKLANNWAECLQLWGCRAEVRKAKRLSDADVKWEVKIWGISNQQLDRIAINHTSPFQSVPQIARPAEKKSEDADLAGHSPMTGSDASSAAKPQVSLVLGKADNIYISYFVQVGDRTLGRVEKLSATSKWSVPGTPGTWETREAAADALIAKREADRKLHQDTNDLLRAKYGLPA
jgi:hypothetical protein